MKRVVPDVSYLVISTSLGPDRSPASIRLIGCKCLHPQHLHNEGNVRGSLVMEGLFVSAGSWGYRIEIKISQECTLNWSDWTWSPDTVVKQTV